MVNRFEAAGIFLSVVFMAMALFILNVDTATEELASLNNENSEAAVILSDKNPATSLYNAVDSSGRINSLVIDDVIVGSGKPVSLGDRVSVHYIGSLANGQQFDNSYTKNEPFEFTVGGGEVIAGWEEGVIGMKETGQRILVIPPELAYGDARVGPIPPDSTLVFAIELLSINEE